VAPLPRAWLYLLPLYAIHAGAGLSYGARRLPRPALANAVGAAALTAALGASMLDSGELNADQPPSSDNDIAAFLRQELRPREPALLDPGSVAVSSSYYFHRYAYGPPGLPPRRRPLQALVVVSRVGGRPAVDRVLHDVGWRLQPGAPPPRLVRRFDYIEAWDARIE
jgi:hypothetical protein